MTAGLESAYQPLILKPGDQSLAKLTKSADVTVVDNLEDQLTELNEITKLAGQPAASDEGVWVYFPWRRALVRTLSPLNFHRVRISRNFNLITPAEQAQFEKAVIGIAGLNVGNPAAICMALEGVLVCGKYADHDILSLSNLNRFRAGLPELGLTKTTLSARQSFEINPFMKLELFAEGIKPGQEDQFLLGPRLSVLVEEMDQLPLKISIRERARESGIPVVMVTGNGPNVIVDVERFDLDRQLPLLNGYLRADIIDQVKSGRAAKLGPTERIWLARDFMGEQYLTKRLRQSFLEVGRSLAGIPQLAESSFMRGAVVAYAVRQIITGAELPSGRYVVELDKLTGNRVADA